MASSPFYFMNNSILVVNNMGWVEIVLVLTHWCVCVLDLTSVWLWSHIRSSTAFTSSVQHSWTTRWQKAAPASTRLIPGAPPSSPDLSALHAATACCPPPPPHLPRCPIIKSLLLLEGRSPNAILHSLHHPECTATMLLMAIVSLSSRLSFRAPVFPVSQQYLTIFGL